MSDKTNYYDSHASFIAADRPSTTAPIEQASLIRRADVMQAVGGVIEAYQVQQRTLLDQVTGETVGGRGGFLSNADQVMERRKTSRMYLVSYGFVSAMTMGGLAYLATLAGVDSAASLAGWITGTGALTLLLAWRRHGDEFAHSAEGIARLVVDAHWNLSEYEAETRRKAIAWEHQAEGRRQQASERAAEHGRQLAQLRIEEMDARRKAADAQRAQFERQTLAFLRLDPEQTVQAGQGEAIDDLQGQSIQNDSSEAPGAPSTVLAGQSWQAALLAWVASLYDDGATTEAGVIKGRVPWAARSPWADSDKAQAKRVCCELRPALIVAGEGGRWRLRREMFSTVDQALQVLAGRLS